MNIDTVLHDILECIGAGKSEAEKYAIYERSVGLTKAATQAFAKQNGWKQAGTSFHIKHIGKHCNAGSFMDQFGPREPFSDHNRYFRADRRNAAVVCQPYAGVPNSVERAKAYAEQLGLGLFIPPNPRASIHYPGRTLFLVFADKSHNIRWLPEQQSGVRFESEREELVSA